MQSRLAIMLTFASVVAFVVACGRDSGQQAAASKELAEARAQVARLEANVATLRTDLAKVRADVTLQKLRSDNYKTAVFDPAAGEGFSRLDTSIGTFTVSIQDVQPFADGVRVRLDIGNLTSASATSAVLKAKWGRRQPNFDDPDFTVKYESWEKSIQEKEVKLVQPLTSGRWNKVTITLPGTRPQEFGYLELSMDTPQISLLVPR